MRITDATLNTRSHRPRERGIVTVEMALCLPIVIFLTFALIEYGWLFVKAHQITNAARQGARVAATPDVTAGEAQAAVDAVMTDGGMSGSGYSTSINPGVNGEPGSSLTVTVSVPYANVDLMGIPLIPVPANLSASTTMAKEGP